MHFVAFVQLNGVVESICVDELHHHRQHQPASALFGPCQPLDLIQNVATANHRGQCRFALIGEVIPAPPRQTACVGLLHPLGPDLFGPPAKFHVWLAVRSRRLRNRTHARTNSLGLDLRNDLTCGWTVPPKLLGVAFQIQQVRMRDGILVEVLENVVQAADVRCVVARQHIAHQLIDGLQRRTGKLSDTLDHRE